MKKRILSILLSLCMVCMLLPTTALAAEPVAPLADGDTHIHPICGKTCADGEHTQNITWTPIETEEELKAASANGYYYLTTNVTLTETWTPADGVKLCLNGHTITETGKANAIYVLDGVTFTLTDCGTTGTITHTAGKKGCGVYVGGIFNMYDGSITGNTVLQYGGGVAVYGGSFNMYGGTISGNTAENGGGVYVQKNSGNSTSNMFGGSITNNTATQSGGGVYMYSYSSNITFNMYGGTISGNTAENGGGVYVVESNSGNSTFNMSGGSITNNEATSNSDTEATPHGGGVYVNGGTFNMSDSASITGNKASVNGGGVYVKNYGTFSMRGGTIGGTGDAANKAKNGGGVYTSGTFTMSGSAEVSYNTAASKGGGVYNNCNTFSLADGSITNNTAATGGGVYCDRSDTKPGNVTLSGKARIANNHAGDANSNLYLLKNGTVVASGLTAGAGIGVSTAVDVASSQLNVQVTSDTVSANYFTSDNTTYITQIAGSNGPGYVVLTQRSASTTHNHSCVCGATHILSNGHDTEKNLTNWVGISDLDLITGAGNYYLTDNVTLTEAIAYDSGSYCGWKAPDGVVLCLNGKNIIMRNPDNLVSESGKAKNADVILVTGRFTLTDCAGTQGKITHANDKIGRGITVLGGTLDMYGGQITGNTTTEYGTGGGVRVEGAEDAASSTTFNLYGGSINGNQSGYGGGVYVSRVVWEGASQFNMYGGSITDNTSTVTDKTFSSHGVGGGVCVSWTAAFKMTGGSITGNTAKFDGAGVYLSALAKNNANETGEQRTAKFEVSGSPNITGNNVNNADNNVYLDTDTHTNEYFGFTNTVDASITILEGLNDNAKIGVTAKKVPTLGNRVLAATGATTNKNYSSIFTSDNASYEVQNRNDGTLRLAVRGDSSPDSSHVHSWTYAIKEGTTNTIVATCNAAGCPNPNGGSVTITAPEHKTYGDGKSAEAQLTKANWQGKNIDENSITYGKQDGTPLPAAPTEAGKYKASITVDGAAAFVVYEITGGTTENIPVSGVALNKTSTSISVGNSEKLTATVTPENAANKDLKWASSNTSVATVAPDGTVTAVKAGTAAITATAADGSGKSATCTVTVTGGTTPSQPGGSTGGSSSGGSYTSPTYKVESEVTEDTDGSVSFSKNSAKKGDTVTITVTPDRYYKVDGVTVKDSSGKEIAVTDNGDGTFTFKMPGSKVTVEPVFSWDNPFADVAENAYYAPAVEWALKNDITDGVDAAHFAPNASCTRAQIVTFLWRAAGCPAPKSSTMPFTDVKAGSYYETAVLWAVENGITKGTGDTTFSPNATCSRAQIVSFLYRAASSPAVSGSAVFTDVSAGSYYANAVAWAVENGITGGTGNNAFSPNADCTRAQIVSFLYRWMVK